MNQVSVKSIPLRQVSSVRELLVNEHAKGRLASVAAKHMNPERMMMVVANAMRTTRDLDKSEPLSLLGALMTCASLGLEPNTPLGHAYLIPFKNNKKGIVEVQLIIGYKGFADLARRSGQVLSLHADVVYDDDEMWSYEYGSNMHLRHKPGPRKGRKTHAYCHVKLVDGEAFVVLPWDQVIATRDRSQGWNAAKRFNKTADHPWTVYEDRMAAKTAVRALANAGEMPLSIEFMQATDLDENRADFKSFAMDPTSGVDGMTIEAEAEAPDGDEDGPDMIETEVDPPNEDTKPKPKAKPKPEPEPTPNPSRREYDDPPPKEPKRAQMDAAAAKKIADEILSSLLDGAPVAATLRYFEDRLARMATSQPELHATLMAEVDGFRDSDEDQEQKNLV